MGFHPRIQDLPTEFAAFPLAGALLLPKGQLPLNIFEPRYLAMTEDSLCAGRMFGMIQPDPSLPEDELGPGLYRVGCLGRVSSFSETDDGRFLITLTGVIRFTIAAELPMERGYRRLRGSFAGYHSDVDLSPQPIGVDREVLLAALRAYLARRNFEPSWDAIRRMPDDVLLVTLSMVCPFQPVEKQALLEAAAGPDRGAVLLALLRMGAAESDDPPGHLVT